MREGRVNRVLAKHNLFHNGFANLAVPLGRPWKGATIGESTNLGSATVTGSGVALNATGRRIGGMA